MRTTVRKMGNSKGVLIPKPLLEESGLESEVEMTVERGALVLRAARPQTRVGWAEASKAIAEAADNAPAWPEFPNKDDDILKW